MKKCFSIFLIICLFLLSGCSQSDEVDSMRMDMAEKNLKIKSVVSQYNLNENNVKEFNDTFISLINCELDTFITDMNSGFTDLSKYTDDFADMYTDLVSLRTAVEDYNKTITEDDVYIPLESRVFPFMRSDGTVEDYFIITFGNSVYYYTVIWENGRFIETEFIRG